mgnify:CR=1 FL=1
MWQTKETRLKIVIPVSYLFTSLWQTFELLFRTPLKMMVMKNLIVIKPRYLSESFGFLMWMKVGVNTFSKLTNTRSLKLIQFAGKKRQTVSLQSIKTVFFFMLCFFVTPPREISTVYGLYRKLKRLKVHPLFSCYAISQAVIHKE